MNIVYLIGNGFDLNWGMKTSFSNFCEYYKDLPTDDNTKIVKKLQDYIKKDFESWSNFEFKLGEFLDNTVEVQDAIVLHSHLIDHLKKFIEKEENKYIFDKTQKDIFHKYLSKPYDNNRLLFTDLKEVENFMLDRKHSGWDVKIITFNYTRSIENLLDLGIPIETDKFNRKVFLSEIEHIHGFTNGRLVLGVNDVSQIASDILRAETKVTDRYIKFNCNNNGYNEKHDEKCQRWINNADIVCLFGLSFGDTDKRWWNIVSNVIQKKNGMRRVGENGKVIIFEYWSGDLPDDNHGNDMNDLKDEIKNRFLSKTTISDDSKVDIKKDMYVVFNTDMFNFGKLKKRIETNSESV